MTDALDLTALASELESFIAETVPAAVTVNKYGGTLFTVKPAEKEGQFCGVFVYKQHVQVSFSRGDLLSDPRGMLSGGGKLRRHVNFATVGEVNFAYFRTLLVQSASLT